MSWVKQLIYKMVYKLAFYMQYYIKYYLSTEVFKLKIITNTINLFYKRESNESGDGHWDDSRLDRYFITLYN